MEVTIESSNITKTLANYPTNKLTIIGGGIVGFLEAYYAYLDAKTSNKSIRITMYDKNPTIKETTTAHIVPCLAPDEILSVVPIGQDFIDKLCCLFSEMDGLRVDDVVGVNDSVVAEQFKRAVAEYGKNGEAHRVRTEALLELGKMSMDLWMDIYNHSDVELKNILMASNFNPCQEIKNSSEPKTLHCGYRMDLFYNIPNTLAKANEMIADYQRLGYNDCKILSPNEVLGIDPFLVDFCNNYTELSEDGTRIWKNNALVLWRPGGCIDTQVFLPLFYDYLKKVMGKYTNSAGQIKDCFQFHWHRQVEQVTYEETALSSNKLNGLKFFGDPKVKRNNYNYPQSNYVFCPGEAVGTLKKLGFAEPEYARFAGASLLLSINIPADKLAEYSKLNHYMEIHQDTVGLAWQARIIANKIFIGIAGSRAFYGDQQPHKDHAFAKNRNLYHLNIINDVLPGFVSLALGRSTQGTQLTQEDMNELETRGIAKRWVGTRAVAYDGFPTVGPVYNRDGLVSNARCTTHLGSGGASFSPAAVCVSRRNIIAPKITLNLSEKVLEYGSSQRTCSSLK